MKNIAELELSLDVHYNKYLGEETKRIAAEARVAELENALYELECSYTDTADDECYWCSMPLYNPYTQSLDHEQGHSDDCRWKNNAWTILKQGDRDEQY
jgi:hypothetical protein